MGQAKNKKVKGHISTHELTGSGGRGVVNRNNTYAMAAACSVEMKPDIIALGPIRNETSADSTPIWKPSEPKFA